MLKTKPLFRNVNHSTRTINKCGVILFLFSFAVALSAWSYYSDPVPTGRYALTFPANFGNRINIPVDNITTKQGVYLGRLLFYEPHLSANNTISCGSCHEQRLAFTDGRPFGKGFDNVPTPRNTMSLANLLWTRKFFWDGRATSLEEQAQTPLTAPHEMGQTLDLSAKKIAKIPTFPPLFKLAFGDQKVTGDRIVKAIAQFERTLISANSKFDQFLRNEYKPTDDELAGMALFSTAPQPNRGIRGANCAHCHGGVKNYMELFHNNGLDSIPTDKGIEALTGLPGDLGRFKVPTLRNIALTAPYMHDGRFRTLEQVIDHYNEHILKSTALSPVFRGESNQVNGQSLALSPNEKKQIIAYLQMLTDSSFITNPQFADPHLHR